MCRLQRLLRITSLHFVPGPQRLFFLCPRSQLSLHFWSPVLKKSGILQYVYNNCINSIEKRHCMSETIHECLRCIGIKREFSLEGVQNTYIFALVTHIWPHGGGTTCTKDTVNYLKKCWSICKNNTCLWTKLPVKTVGEPAATSAIFLLAAFCGVDFVLPCGVNVIF